MEDWILGNFEKIKRLTDISSSGYSYLSDSLEAAMPAFYGFSSSFSSTYVMPLAYTLLALFFLLELYRASLKIENGGGGATHGAEVIFRVMVKMVLCKIMLDNTPLIMSAIYDTFSGLIGSAGSTGAASSIDLDLIATQIDGIKWWDGLGWGLISMLIMIITAIAYIAVQIIMFARLFEVYIYLAVAPLPLATLPNDEYSGIAKNFLKSFAGLGLQGVAIYLILQFFPMIFGAISGLFQDSGFGWTCLICVAQSLTVIVALMGSGRLAKSIMQAM